MIRGHVSSDLSPDIVEGKGKGVMILLHGGPGTGKTLTAESVAELAERPLYRVSCGDIGTDPEKVETYLDSVLHIGQMWQAGKCSSPFAGNVDRSDTMQSFCWTRVMCFSRSAKRWI